MSVGTSRNTLNKPKSMCSASIDACLNVCVTGLKESKCVTGLCSCVQCSTYKCYTLVCKTVYVNLHYSLVYTIYMVDTCISQNIS